MACEGMTLGKTILEFLRKSEFWKKFIPNPSVKVNAFIG